MARAKRLTPAEAAALCGIPLSVPVAKAAEALGLSVSQVNRLLDSGELVAVRRGPHRRNVLAESVRAYDERWNARQETETAGQQPQIAPTRRRTRGAGNRPAGFDLMTRPPAPPSSP